ncbi:MAG: ATP-binding cassette domain-containing protein [Desulfurococcales archaeon]|nr:ATP-binding cassette domain-containing protein [Desulfurococcales archaeon]
MRREECAVETIKLEKTYKNGVKALKGVSFCIRVGEIFSLLGPNGAGKTTTVKILSTLIKPSGGTAYVGGYNVVEESSKVRKIIGIVPQDLTADDEMTGYDNVYVQARLHGLSRNEAKKKTEEVLEFMGLLEAANRKARTYSGGMRKRLEIAMSLVHSPRLLFLDEPTLGLDVQSRRHLWDLIRKLKMEGTTILLTTHYMEEADALSDRIAIIDLGKVVALGSPEELKARLGGDRIYIKPVLNQDLISIKERLERKGYEVSILNGEVIVKVKKAEDSLFDIINLLRDSKISSLRISKPNLEDVFLELTGRKLRDEEPLDSFRYRIHSMRVRR